MKEVIETAVILLVAQINAEMKSEDALRISQAALNIAHVGSVLHNTNKDA